MTHASVLTGRRLFVAIPSYDHKINVNAMLSLVELGQRAIVHEFALQVRTLCGCSIVSTARNALVDFFMKSNATDLFFLDSDITFKAEDVVKLMMLTTKFDMVAGVYRLRAKDRLYRINLDMANDELVMNKAGLVRAERIGMGFTMIRRHVIEKLLSDHPEWEYAAPEEYESPTLRSIFDFKSTRDGYVGEDCLFCDRVREAGYEIWIDPAIKLGHMNYMELDSDYGKDAITPVLWAARQQKTPGA